MTGTGAGPALSVVVPVYRCHEVLARLLEEVSTTIAGMGLPFEVILVDDDCPEGSWEEIERLAGEFPQASGVKLACNVGQAGAISEGLRRARGAHVLVMDGDLQDPAAMIPVFYACAKERAADIVFGQRADRGHRMIRRVLSGAYRLLAALSPVPDMKRYGSFTLLSERAVREHLAMPESGRLFVTALTWLDLPHAEVEYGQRPRPRGTSSYTVMKLLRLVALRLFLRRNPVLLFSLALVLAAMLATLAQGSGGPHWNWLVALQLLPAWCLVELGARLYRRSRLRSRCEVAAVTPRDDNPPHRSATGRDKEQARSESSGTLGESPELAAQ